METVSEYLAAARTARKKNNFAEAKQLYELILEEDPSHTEASFFVACYTIEYGNSSEVYNNYMKFSEVIMNTIIGLKHWDMSEKEKEDLLSDMSYEVCRLPSTVYRKLGSTNLTREERERLLIANKSSIGNYYFFGDLLEIEYDSDLSNSGMKSIAVWMWKRGIELQREWTAVEYDKNSPKKYAEKIKKYDPTYVLPKENILRKIFGRLLAYTTQS